MQSSISRKKGPPSLAQSLRPTTEDESELPDRAVPPVARVDAAPRSPTRVMQLLETLAVSGNGLSLSRLSAKLGTPKTSVLSLLRALEASEHVVNDEGTYRLGAASFRLAALMTGGTPLARAVRTPLLALAGQSNESALVALLTDSRRQAMCIDIVESRKTLRFSMVIGTRIPLYSTTVGRAMLAFQTDRFIDTYLAETELHQHTEKTLLATADIRRALNVVRRTGISEVFEEYADGVGGIGAPIVDPAGNVQAAVQIAGPVARVKERRKELAGYVRDSGERTSRLIGYTGAYPPPQE